MPKITLKADTALTTAQADMQNTFGLAAETDAKTLQPTDVPLRKQKENREIGKKTRQPLRTSPKRLLTWFKSRRLPVKILLCVAVTVVLLAVGILMNLLWDYTLYKKELPCPDPVDYFSLIETDGDAYTGFMDGETSLEAIRAYQTLLEKKYNADVTIVEEDEEQHRYVLDIDLNQWSLFGTIRRGLTVTYQDSDATWYIEVDYWSRVKFVPVESYLETATSDGNTGGQELASGDEAQSVNATAASSKKAQRVAEAVDLSYLCEKPENGVQDIRYWSEGAIQFCEKPLPMGSYTIYYFKTD